MKNRICYSASRALHMAARGCISIATRLLDVSDWFLKRVSTE